MRETTPGERQVLRTNDNANANDLLVPVRYFFGTVRALLGAFELPRMGFWVGLWALGIISGLLEVR